jgi:hypothetical protein
LSHTVKEESLFQWARASLPYWYFVEEGANEFLHLAAAIHAWAYEHASEWLRLQAFIEAATGGDEADWLQQHAKDRGTWRQDGESDDMLRSRLRNPEDAVTRPALLAFIDAALAAAGLGSAAMIEMPRDEAYLGDFVSDAGLGGTFGRVGSPMVFTPLVDFAGLPYRGIFPADGHNLVIAGAAQANNNGTHPTTGIAGDGVTYTDANGVTGQDPSVSWTVQKLDRRGNLKDGWNKTFLSRGQRVGSALPVIVVMLPVGVSDALLQSITELASLKKAAGVLVLVEPGGATYSPGLTESLAMSESVATVGPDQAGLGDFLWWSESLMGGLAETLELDETLDAVGP